MSTQIMCIRYVSWYILVGKHVDLMLSRFYFSAYHFDSKAISNVPLDDTEDCLKYVGFDEYHFFEDLSFVAIGYCVSRKDRVLDGVGYGKFVVETATLVVEGFEEMDGCRGFVVDSVDFQRIAIYSRIRSNNIAFTLTELKTKNSGILLKSPVQLPLPLLYPMRKGDSIFGFDARSRFFGGLRLFKISLKDGSTTIHKTLDNMYMKRVYEWFELVSCVNCFFNSYFAIMFRAVIVFG
jgi:hypothetical protein